MVSSVDGLAGAAALVLQVPPQRREVASEAATGARTAGDRPSTLIHGTSTMYVPSVFGPKILIRFLPLAAISCFPILPRLRASRLRAICQAPMRRGRCQMLDVGLLS